MKHMHIDKQQEMIREKIKEAREKIAVSAGALVSQIRFGNEKHYTQGHPLAPNIGAIEKEVATIQMHISHLHRLDGALAMTFSVEGNQFNQRNQNEQN